MELTLFEKLKTRFLNYKELREIKKQEIHRLTVERLMVKGIRKMLVLDSFTTKPSKENLEKYLELTEKGIDNKYRFTIK